MCLCFFLFSRLSFKIGMNLWNLLAVAPKHEKPTKKRESDTSRSLACVHGCDLKNGIIKTFGDCVCYTFFTFHLLNNKQQLWHFNKLQSVQMEPFFIVRVCKSDGRREGGRVRVFVLAFISWLKSLPLKHLWLSREEKWFFAQQRNFCGGKAVKKNLNFDCTA